MWEIGVAENFVYTLCDENHAIWYIGKKLREIYILKENVIITWITY